MEEDPRGHQNFYKSQTHQSNLVNWVVEAKYKADEQCQRKRGESDFFAEEARTWTLKTSI